MAKVDTKKWHGQYYLRTHQRNKKTGEVIPKETWRNRRTGEILGKTKVVKTNGRHKAITVFDGKTFFKGVEPTGKHIYYGDKPPISRKRPPLTRQQIKAIKAKSKRRR